MCVCVCVCVTAPRSHASYDADISMHAYSKFTRGEQECAVWCLHDVIL